MNLIYLIKKFLDKTKFGSPKKTKKDQQIYIHLMTLKNIKLLIYKEAT